MIDIPSEGDESLNNKDVFERALANYYLVRLVVGYHPQVVLPEFLMTPTWRNEQAVVHLEYGLDMAVPITDLVVTDAGVAATLSFSRVPHTTFVPWAAVVGFAVDGARPLAPKPKFKLKAV